MGIVTGAASGIGEATARLLAQRGLDIVLVARRRERLEALATELSGDGRRVVALPFDLGEPEAPEAVVEATLAELGRLDVIVNNAAAFKLHGGKARALGHKEATLLQYLTRIEGGEPIK